MQNKLIGNKGEDLASSFLEQKGYVIIERNCKLSYFEIDIIAKIAGKIAFIEVKTKASSSSLWQAEELLSPKKYQAFRRGVQAYCAKYKINLNKISMELVAIDFNRDNTANIKHYLDII